eukprot:5170013-Amphidinium_carterae.1
MKGKCLNCGSTSHLKAACNRPMATGRNLEAEYAEQRRKVIKTMTLKHLPMNPSSRRTTVMQPEDDPNAAGMKGK